MAIENHSVPDTKPSIWKRVTNWGYQNGWVFILTIITGYNAYVTWNAEILINRADQQSEINSRIGVIEGKLDILLDDRQNIQKGTSQAIIVILTPTPIVTTISPPIIQGH